MKEREVRLSDNARRDLISLYDYLEEVASARQANAYLSRLTDFIERLSLFSERGTKRDDVRPGLRVIGFEKRVSVAFIVEDDEAIVLRILYAGRSADLRKR